MHFRPITAIALALTLALPAAAARPRHAAAHHASSAGGSKKSSRKGAATRKSTASHAPMSTERATEIQAALIKQGYLSGTPTGTWDSSSQAAMQKLQSDNGWQTKIVPDSRAIIKLGLGPTAPAKP